MLVGFGSWHRARGCWDSGWVWTSEFDEGSASKLGRAEGGDLRLKGWNDKLCKVTSHPEGRVWELLDGTQAQTPPFE